MDELKDFLEKSAARHSHLCPRQVLGVRAALRGIRELGLALPRKDRRLLVILETDGCFADGVEVVSGATVGHRRMRIEDFGKIAATFVDIKTGRAVRVWPVNDLRSRARTYAPPEERRRYFIQLYAYQVMPEEELLSVQEVELTESVETIISYAGRRTVCSSCGEEIFNQRELIKDGQALCRSCNGPSYYRIKGCKDART